MLLREQWRQLEFPEAVALARFCVGLEDFRLEPKQEEALVHLYNGHDVFAWFSRLWQVFMLPTAALYVPV